MLMGKRIVLPLTIMTLLYGVVSTLPTIEQRLNQLRFLNSGTVRQSDNFTLLSISSIYNEGYNYRGQGHFDWTNLGKHGWAGLDYLMKDLNNGSATCNITVIGQDIDLPGNDIKQVSIGANSSASDCADLCCTTESCAAYVFEPQTDVTMGSCNHGDHCCFLKSFASKPKPKKIPGGITAGSISHYTSYATPPNGMRSSVPLGPLGEGSVELRADGRLADWGTIFNNGPYTPDKGWAHKIDIDEAAFGLYTAGGKGSLIRTHDPRIIKDSMDAMPLADELTYSGAFPVSQLQINSSNLLPINATMYAYSEFEMHNPNRSIAPIVFFSFVLTNPSKNAINASVFFNMPDIIDGKWSRSTSTKKNESDLISLTLTKKQSTNLKDSITTGDLSISVVGSSTTHVSTNVSPDILTNWEAFIKGGGTLPGRGGSGTMQHGAIAAQTIVPADGSTTITIALSWFFPHRLWGSVDLGHYYQNFYPSSHGVATKELPQIESVLDSILKWQANCFNNSYPIFLQDALVNSPSAWGKTALFTKDGRWRQFESHSCAQMEPPHIHFYRALGYALFFPDIERQTPSMYSQEILKDGTVSELFGCGCGGCAGGGYNLDRPAGGARGDDNPVYILDVYMNWKWRTDGKQYLEKVWNSTSLAINFTLQHAAKYNLTFRMVNTNDEHGNIGDINSYNAFVYLSSTAAGIEMAHSMGDSSLESRSVQALNDGRIALQNLLWNKNGFWGQTWCESGVDATNALQGGVLYGQLWAHVLGLSNKVNIPQSNLSSHLLQERHRNISPLGLIFATNRTNIVYWGNCKKGILSNKTTLLGIRPDGTIPHGKKTGFIDQDVWNSHSMTHTAMSLYTRTGSAKDALDVAKLVIDAYRNIMRDQWDYRDTTTPYNDETGRYDPSGIPRPSVNSHYGRQTIFWSIPLALTGQQYNALTKSLWIDPHPFLLEPSGQSWPLLLPSGSALAQISAMNILNTSDTTQCLLIHRLSGNTDFVTLNIFLHNIKLHLISNHIKIQSSNTFGPIDFQLCE